MPPMKRLELHDRLTAVLGSDAVYFQPPESVKMIYPCVVYSLAYIDSVNADNANYINHYRYVTTFITKDPDDFRIEKFKELPQCKFDRYFVSDNLHHYSYEITMI